jgi:hypothetical protein
MDDLTEIFGAPISIYTRAQAIEDGMLVQLPADVRTPFKYPVAITSSLWAEIVRGAGKKDAHTRNARIWDVCFMAVMASKFDASGGKKGEAASDVFYPCLIGRKTHNLWCNIGPDDTGAPCFTIGFPGDR